MQKTLSILVDDTPGVLARIGGLFYRRGYNITSLSVGQTESPGKSRFTVTFEGDEATAEQIRKQAQKLINVIKTSEHGPDNSEIREYALIKVSFNESNKTEIHHLVEFYKGKIIDIFDGAAIIEITEEDYRIDKFMNRLSHYGIIESLRTGKVVMFRGSKSINSSRNRQRSSE